MSMSYLTSHAMVAVSHDLLTDAGKVGLLERDELTRGLVGRVRVVHDELSLMTKVDGELQERLAEISEEQRVCDQVHDRITRGIYRALESTADLCATAEEGRRFMEVRDVLFPEGISINTLSYREESGNVLKVAQRATVSIRAVLGLVVANGKTLEHYFDVWVENGAQLGRLVAERASLIGEDDDTRVSAGDLREVRNRWIRTMNVLSSTLDLIDMGEKDRRRLLSNLQDAVAAAVRTRAAEQKRKAGVVVVVDGEDVVDVAGDGDGEVGQGQVLETDPVAVDVDDLV